MKQILVFIMLILLSFIILEIDIKKPIIGFILIIISHTFLTYEMVKHINNLKDLLKIKVIKIIGSIVVITIIIKHSLGYYDGVFILNNIFGLSVEPLLARIFLLFIIVVFIVLPIWQKRHTKK